MSEKYPKVTNLPVGLDAKFLAVLNRLFELCMTGRADAIKEFLEKKPKFVASIPNLAGQVQLEESSKPIEIKVMKTVLDARLEHVLAWQTYQAAQTNWRNLAGLKAITKDAVKVSDLEDVEYTPPTTSKK